MINEQGMVNIHWTWIKNSMEGYARHFVKLNQPRIAENVDQDNEVLRANKMLRPGIRQIFGNRTGIIKAQLGPG